MRIFYIANRQLLHNIWIKDDQGRHDYLCMIIYVL